MQQVVLIVLFGLAFGTLALTMLSLVEERSVRLAARAVVAVAMIPFALFAVYLVYWGITGIRPS